MKHTQQTPEEKTKQNKRILYTIMILVIVAVAFFAGMAVALHREHAIVFKDYDLYQCIWINSAANNFPQDAEMIQHIEHLCITLEGKQ